MKIKGKQPLAREAFEAATGSAALEEGQTVPVKIYLEIIRHSRIVAETLKQWPKEIGDFFNRRFQIFLPIGIDIVDEFLICLRTTQLSRHPERLRQRNERFQVRYFRMINPQPCETNNWSILPAQSSSSRSLNSNVSL